MLAVAREGAPELLVPQRGILRRHRCSGTVGMPMPEATVDEDKLPPPWKHDVRATGKVVAVKPVPIPQPGEDAPDDALRFSVERAHRRHPSGRCFVRGVPGSPWRAHYTE